MKMNLLAGKNILEDNSYFDDQTPLVEAICFIKRYVLGCVLFKV